MVAMKAALAQDCKSVSYYRDFPRRDERKGGTAVLNMYSDKAVEELMDKMLEYLKEHQIYELMELVASAIATVEQK